MAIEDESIIQIAARLVGVMAILVFAVFACALWAPKVSTGVQATNAQQLQQPSIAHKKKGKNTKKKPKPARGVGAKSKKLSEELSEEELAVAHVQSSSDVEAPSIPANTSASDASDVECADTHAQISSCVRVETDDDSESEDLEMCVKLADAFEASKTPDVTLEPAEEVCACEEASGTCKMCSNLGTQNFGCPTHRTYSSSLLLMHCGMQRRIAKGAPGLAAPANLSITSYRLCTMQVP